MPGCNVGPNLAVTGSLATMLVVSRARRSGVEVGARALLRVGAVVTPLLLLVSALALSWCVRN